MSTMKRSFHATRFRAVFFAGITGSAPKIKRISLSESQEQVWCAKHSLQKQEEVRGDCESLLPKAAGFTPSVKV